MLQTKVRLDLGQVLGEADPQIYGQYIEHLSPDERCIYGAIQDEGSSRTDERGFRLDVIEAVRELAPPVVRWPGGCFADIYHWEDGIGPREQRPVRRNWHWGGLESNQFGTDEFLSWCEMVGTTPYINVNLGTGTLDEAIRWIDYCNGHDATHEVQMRQRNGRQDPYNVRLWGIGNEQWGDWEAGHMGAREYAAKLRSWAQFFRNLDPQVQLLGVGSNAAGDTEWDFEVLKTAGHLIDYLTVHMYTHCWRDDTSEEEYYAIVTSSVIIEERLHQLVALIEAATKHLATRPRISIDEWNIRHMVSHGSARPELDRSSPRTLRDTLFAAGVLHAMLRHAPSVAMGCYVFLLNGNAVMRVDPTGIVKTPLFDLFHAYRKYLFPTVLQARVTTEEFLTAVRHNRIDKTVSRSVPYVDVVATYDTSGHTLALAIINRHATSAAHIQLEPDRFTCSNSADVWELHDEDVMASNDAAHPDRLRMQHTVTDWSNALTVKPHSVTIVRVGTTANL